MAKFFAPSKISENMRATPEGFLLCLNVPIARTGVYDYGPGESPIEVGEGGVAKVERTPEEVFNPKTMASFEGKPLTIEHPKEFVSPENWKDLAKGTIQNVRKGEGEYDGWMIADVLINDEEAISLVKEGMRALSCGYEADCVQTDVGRGYQQNIIGNHLALVEAGRAGPDCEIRDSQGAKMSTKPKKNDWFKKFQDTMISAFKDAEGQMGEETAKDADPAASAKEGNGTAYDELVKTMKDLCGKMDAAMESKKPKPADADASEQVEGTDADPEENSLEQRLAKLEQLVTKMVQGTSDEDPDGDEMDDDDDLAGGGGMEDDDKDAPGKHQDSVSRAEILSPGIEKKGKSLEKRALEAAYKTEDGKKVIETLTGGKKPNFNDAAQVKTMFIAAAELIRSNRGESFSRHKTLNPKQLHDKWAPPKTADDINKANEAFWNKSK